MKSSCARPTAKSSICACGTSEARGGPTGPAPGHRRGSRPAPRYGRCRPASAPVGRQSRSPPKAGKSLTGRVRLRSGGRSAASARSRVQRPCRAPKGRGTSTSKPRPVSRLISNSALTSLKGLRRVAINRRGRSSPVVGPPPTCSNPATRAVSPSRYVPRSALTQRSSALSLIAGRPRGVSISTGVRSSARKASPSVGWLA